VGRWLGEGLAALAAILDPGCFVLGGGVSEAGDLLLGEARTAFENGLTGRLYRPHAAIVLAELGQDAGLIGAACLARLRLRQVAPESPVIPFQAQNQFRAPRR
jgi:glucokinase